MKHRKVGVIHLDCLRFARHSGPVLSKEDQNSLYRVKNEYLSIKNNDPINIIKNKYLKINDKKILNYRKN